MRKERRKERRKGRQKERKKGREEDEKNKAVYSALDASRRRLREGVTDGRTDRPSYRDSRPHLKTLRCDSLPSDRHSLVKSALVGVVDFSRFSTRFSKG